MINRNNYEEYFLLYADKELSSADRSMVESFVKNNPDLEEEFLMIQQSVIKPEDIILEDKAALMHKEGTIGLSNYQEKLLLYTDNELGADEYEEVEKFISSHPSLQKEFNQLQKVTYEADRTIVFPDKNLLYRNEEKPKVVPIPWRMLAAAILTAAGIWVGARYMQHQEVKPEVALDKPLRRQADTTKPVTPAITEPAIVKTIEKKNPVTEPVRKEPLMPQPQMVKYTVPPKTDIPIKVDTVKYEMVKLDNNLPKPIRQVTDPVEKITQPVTVQATNPETQYAMQASYIADEGKSENYVFYNITSEEFKKSKVGNFLKKIKRGIEKRIPLRNSLRIGNVEIAKDEQN